MRLLLAVSCLLAAFLGVSNAAVCEGSSSELGCGAILKENESVLTVKPDLENKDKLFVMLNGANEGTVVTWTASPLCFRYAILSALAHSDVLTQDEVAREERATVSSLRVYNGNGDLIRTPEEVEAAGFMVHVLLPAEAWVWPGIQIGHTWTVDLVVRRLDKDGQWLKPTAARPDLATEVVPTAAEMKRWWPKLLEEDQKRMSQAQAQGSTSGGLYSKAAALPPRFLFEVRTVTMETMSLNPKAIMVHNITTVDECNKIVEVGKTHLRPSPEKHAEPEKYRNWRTSNTAMFDSSLPLALSMRERTMQLARLDRLKQVEHLQAVNYEPGQWYREHNDYFTYKQLQNGRVLWAEWVQGAREAVRRSNVCFNNDQAAICPGRQLYPDMSTEFQHSLLDLILPIPMPKKQRTGAKTAKLQSVNADREAVLKMINLQPGTSVRQWIDENHELRSVDLIPAILDAIPPFAHVISEVWSTLAIGHLLPGNVDMFNETLTKAHFEYIPRGEVQPNRHATLFVYLNNVEKGGETVFPKALVPNVKPGPVDHGMPECAKGLAVKPVMTSAVLFYNQVPSGQNDPLSKHGGCPPVGEIPSKWGANVWTWNTDHDHGVEVWEM